MEFCAAGRDFKVSGSLVSSSFGEQVLIRKLHKLRKREQAVVVLLHKREQIATLNNHSRGYKSSHLQFE